MTGTHEQRAREIVASLFPALTPEGVDSFTRERAEVEAALRAVEAAAYGMAADIALDEWLRCNSVISNDDTPSVVRDGYRARCAAAWHIAGNLRRLALKEGT